MTNMVRPRKVRVKVLKDAVLLLPDDLAKLLVSRGTVTLEGVEDEIKLDVESVREPITEAADDG